MKTISFRIGGRILDELNRISAAYGINKSEIIRRAIVYMIVEISNGNESIVEYICHRNRKRCSKRLIRSLIYDIRRSMVSRK